MHAHNGVRAARCTCAVDRQLHTPSPTAELEASLEGLPVQCERTGCTSQLYRTNII